MDLKNIWQQGEKNDDALKALLEKGDFRKLHSKLPLKKLKQNLLIGITWAILITVGYIVILFFFPIWQVYICLGVVIVFNLFIAFDSWKLYKKTPSDITPSNSLKEELTIHYNSFYRWWNLQKKMSLFVFPVAAAGGFMLGGYLGSGKPVEAFLYNSRMLGMMGITVLVLVPICYFFARWMFDYAYGKHLKKIKATIEELS